MSSIRAARTTMGAATIALTLLLGACGADAGTPATAEPVETIVETVEPEPEETPEVTEEEEPTEAEAPPPSTPESNLPEPQFWLPVGITANYNDEANNHITVQIGKIFGCTVLQIH